MEIRIARIFAAANCGHMTMRELQDRSIHCPYCGEVIDILVDSSVAEQAYIEDCQVCCRPINFSVSAGPDGEVQLRATSDSE